MLVRTLSIIIPAYNEAKTIVTLLDRIRAADIGAIEKDIIIVDDGSTDGTREALQGMTDVRVILHEKNRGKGGAIKTGLAVARGDVVIFQDADLEYDPGDYAAMLAPLIAGAAAWVNGVRIPPDDDPRRGTVLGLLNRVGNRVITVLTNVLYRHDAGEYEGCYKAFPSALLNTVHVATDDFDFDNELVCTLLKRGILPRDVPIRYAPRTYEGGKHIHWRHGFKILLTIVRVRLFRV